MGRLSFRALINRVLKPGRQAIESRRRNQSPLRKQLPCPLALEPLEDRTVPSTLQLLTGLNPTVAPSDAAGQVFQARNSLDGRFVVYTSAATNLIAGQKNTTSASNVFLFDTRTGTTTLISHAALNPVQTANGSSEGARISGDGRYVAFSSRATDLIAGQTGNFGVDNVFLYDLATGTTTLVSHAVSSLTACGDADSDTVNTTGFGSTNAVGRYLLYESYANNLALGGQAGPSGPAHLNLFVYDAMLGTTQLVSHSAGSTTTGANDDANVAPADISGDGNFVTYTSLATDVVPNQSHLIKINYLFGTLTINLPGPNVFLYNRQTQTSTLVSGVQGSASQAAGLATLPITNRDGSLVVYASFDPSVNPNFNLLNLPLAHLVQDIQDLLSGKIPSDLLPNLYLYNRLTGTTTLISAAAGQPNVPANGASLAAAISADGQSVAFVSNASNLVAGQGSNTPNAFLWSASSQGVTLVSHVSGQAGVAAGGVRSLAITPGATLSNVDNAFVSISPDGRFISYQSSATNLVAGQSGPSTQNTFRFDTQTGVNTLASGAGGSDQVSADGDSAASIVQQDGSVLLVSSATNLIAGVIKAGGSRDVFVSPLGGGSSLPAGGNVTPFVTPSFIIAKLPLRLITRGAFPAGAQAFVYSTSADGRFVVFSSNATNLVPGEVDTNADQNIYLLDRQTGTTTLVSHSVVSLTQTASAGSPGFGLAPSTSGVPAVISSDGNYVAFVSSATDLIPLQTGVPGFSNIFLYNRQTGAVTLVSRGATGPNAGGLGFSDHPVISADGSRVAYTSNAKDLLGAAGVVNLLLHGSAFFADNVFLYDRAAGTTTLVSADAATGIFGNGNSGFASISDDGRLVAYQSQATDLVPGGTLPGSNIYLFDQAHGTNTLVSHAASSSTATPNDNSFEAVISSAANAVAFVSYATNLVPGQSSPVGVTNVFRYNVAGGGTVLVSGVNGSPTVSGNANSDSPALSGDGSFVAFRSDAGNLVTGQNGPAGSNIFLFSSAGPAPTVTLLSHAAGQPTTTAAGNSTNPFIDGDGGLVAYLSTATNLVPSQTGSGVTNVFGWVRALAVNFLASGVNGSPTAAASDPTFLPIISRDPIFLFSASGSLTSGSNGASNGYVNTVVQVSLAPNSLPDASPAGTVVGTLTVTTSLSGAFVTSTLSLPAGENDNASFSLGAAQTLVCQVLVNYAVRASYQVTVHVDLGFGDYPSTLAVLVAAPPAFSDDSLFVTGVYHDALGRASDPAGLNRFQAQVDQARLPLLSQLALGFVTSSESRTRLVLGDYTTILGRSAGPSETTGWVAALAQGSNPEQVAAAILGSAEDFNRQGDSNNTWLTQAYVVLLGRQPDPGSQGFLNALNRGVSRFEIAVNIAGSAEYQDRLITQVYTGYLQRAPSPGDLATWRPVVAQPPAGAGQPSQDEQFQAAVIASREYFGLHGASNPGFVTSLYTVVLGRQADSTGYDNALGQLNDGYAPARVSVVVGVLGTPEYRAHLVATDFQTYLGRAASADDVANFENLLVQGTDEQLLAVLAASDEYYSHNGGTNQDFLAALYRDFLHRSPDASTQGILDRLNNGSLSRAQVAAGILASPEYRQVKVATCFQTYLGRAASAPDVANFASLLQETSDEQVLAVLLGSSEYLQHAHSYP
jgi:hypothetical protein